ACVLDCERRLAGKRREQLDRLRWKFPWLVAAHKKAAHDPTFMDHRDGKEGANPRGHEIVTKPALIGSRHGNIRHLHRLEDDGGTSQHPFALSDPSAPPGFRKVTTAFSRR